MRDSKALTRYVLLHVVELALLVAALVVLTRFLSVPLWLVVAIPAASAIKDVVLYPLVWRSYASPDNRPIRGLLGLEATVVYDIDPLGYVRVAGEMWRAKVLDPRYPVRKGDIARVLDVQGMTLVVGVQENTPPG